MYLIAASYIIADFVSGIFHWIEDSYEIPFTTILCYNRLHHEKPYQIVETTFLENIKDIFPTTLLLFILVNYYFGFSLFFSEIMIFITLSNWIHKQAHFREGNIFIWSLQRLGIFQSYEVHHVHHITRNSNYCIMSNYLNPILEYVNFWRNIESLIYKISGIKARSRPDSEIVYECATNIHMPNTQIHRNQYPAL